MSHICDRPLTEFELDCIVLSQERLRKDPKYLELLKKRASISNDLKNGINVKASELAQIEYQIGYWDGKTFADILAENPDGVKIRDVCLDLNERIKKGEFN